MAFWICPGNGVEETALTATKHQAKRVATVAGWIKKGQTYTFTCFVYHTMGPMISCILGFYLQSILPIFRQLGDLEPLRLV